MSIEIIGPYIFYDSKSIVCLEAKKNLNNNM